MAKESTLIQIYEELRNADDYITQIESDNQQLRDDNRRLRELVDILKKAGRLALNNIHICTYQTPDSAPRFIDCHPDIEFRREMMCTLAVLSDALVRHVPQDAALAPPAEQQVAKKCEHKWEIVNECKDRCTQCGAIQEYNQAGRPLAPPAEQRTLGEAVALGRQSYESKRKVMEAAVLEKLHQVMQPAPPTPKVRRFKNHAGEMWTWDGTKMTAEGFVSIYTLENAIRCVELEILYEIDAKGNRIPTPEAKQPVEKNHKLGHSRFNSGPQY